MGDATQPRILVFTAAFGEGHNSAAKALAASLGKYADARVSDPCALGQPRLNAFVKWGYSLCITRLPFLWKLLFKMSDNTDMRKTPLWWLNGSRKALEYEVAGFKPDAIISTYPLYPYFLDDYFRKTGKRIPYYVVVTDSLIINKSWLCVEPDAWLVTDGETRRRMIDRGTPAEKILVTGFPISPLIAEYQPLPAEDWRPGINPRVLYFANRTPSATKSDLTAILEALPEISITIVLGRNVRRLYRTAEKIKAAYLGRVKIIGWTRRVPELLSTHHLVVGKAGGATVHEVLAAECPILVNHVVYGQEEGNAELVKFLGTGEVTLGPGAISAALREIFSGEEPTWFHMKESLKKANMKGGAKIITDLVLQKITEQSNCPPA